MKNSNEIDFGEVQTLLNVIVASGQHGPLYHKILGKAQERMKEIVGEIEKADRVITPAAGPENSAIQKKDGTIESIKPQPQPKPPINPPGAPQEQTQAPNEPVTPHVERRF